MNGTAWVAVGVIVVITTIVGVVIVKWAGRARRERAETRKAYESIHETAKRNYRRPPCG